MPNFGRTPAAAAPEPLTAQADIFFREGEKGSDDSRCHRDKAHNDQFFRNRKFFRRYCKRTFLFCIDLGSSGFTITFVLL